MNRSLLAFLLACLTVAILWGGYNELSQQDHLANRVVVYVPDVLDPVGDEKVKAIEALHLPGVKVMKAEVAPIDFKNFVWGALIGTLILSLLTGFVLFFYKLYCRCFGAKPHL
ncbi:MAG: hypothetical protein LV481_16240 [Methylacidiphilales bacterium]|nr:hypothetical protein [Candidatus Methylacidiphilales bacterium]